MGPIGVGLREDDIEERDGEETGLLHYHPERVALEQDWKLPKPTNLVIALFRVARCTA
jgi:hypothetical protein